MLLVLFYLVCILCIGQCRSRGKGHLSSSSDHRSARRGTYLWNPQASCLSLCSPTTRGLGSPPEPGCIGHSECWWSPDPLQLGPQTPARGVNHPCFMWGSLCWLWPSCPEAPKYCPSLGWASWEMWKEKQWVRSSPSSHQALCRVRTVKTWDPMRTPTRMICVPSTQESPGLCFFDDMV